LAFCIPWIAIQAARRSPSRPSGKHANDYLREIRERCPDGTPDRGLEHDPWHWLTLVVHAVIAISLVALVAISIHDTLTLRATLSDDDASRTSCEQPRLRS